MSTPLFRYYIPGSPGIVNSFSSLWSMPLAGKVDKETTDTSLKFLIKDYFETAEHFICHDNYKILRKGLKFYLKKDTSSSDIRNIDISLEKHGAFYHPAKIRVELNNGCIFFFALNLAVSDVGLALIENEYNALLKLNKSRFDSLIPRVFGMGSINMKKGCAAFFMAEWFNDFNEFHITSPTGSSGSYNGNTIGLWKSNGTIVKIFSPDYFMIYEKISEILTEFYNPVSFEQIFPWHHAAGDFVIKKKEHGFEVRLITVRNYDVLFGTDPDSENKAEHRDNDLLQGLLFFLLNLSLRMRIDRIDGTGEYFFLDSEIIFFVLRGFTTALSKKYLPGIFQTNITEFFWEFARQFSVDNLHEMLAMIVNSYNKNAPDTVLVKKNLHEHCKILFKKITMM